MLKNIKILGILLTAVILTSFGSTYASNRANLVTTLTGTSVKSTTIGIGSVTYPLLYTNSSTYASLFAFKSSKGTSPYYDANAGATFTVTKIGSVQNDVVIVNQKNKTSHALNNYSGVVFY